ncbi:MAG TPA: hypothetical protein VFV99_28635 [Kofleriaceae bacterium]|nr:hypothetical protein [Kofleriaceae bacterium]
MRWWVIALVLGLATPVFAQPWSQGVSEQKKAAAQKKLEEGNALFLKRNFKEAFDAYQAALTSWNHPAIRFNVVRCLIQLDRPVEAYDELTKALEFGKDPFEEAIYNEALNYQKLLATQIAEIEISCSQQGAKVTLDGQPLLTCPGKEKRRVAPGQHGVVGTKEGFLTKPMDIVVVGGKTEAVDVKLMPLDKAAKVVHRWPGWIPWVVFGGGLAVAGVGGLIQINANDLMDDYDRTIARDCANVGCDLTDAKYDDLNNKRDKAEFRNKIAISVMTVGAVGAIAGGVMLVMNRGRTVYDNSAETRGPVTRLDFVPHDDGGVLTLSGGF